MKKRRTQEERNVMMNSLLSILSSTYKPFAFKNLSDFFKWHPYDNDNPEDKQCIAMAQ
jgi:hypothetical protein